MTMPGLALVKEVLHALSEHADLQCTPDIEVEREAPLTLTVRFHPRTDRERLEMLEVQHKLQYLVDATKLRSFVATYGSDFEVLRKLFQQQGCDDVEVQR